MSPLIRELLVNGLMAGTAMQKAKKTTAGIGYYGLAGVVAFIGMLFFAVAGFSWLLAYYSMPIAAVATGATLMLIACAVCGWGHYRIRSKKHFKKPAANAGFIDNVENTVKTMLDGFEEPVKDNPKMALLLAALAGFAAGDQIGDKINTH
ncbi:MAG: phage holin family protein [Micavibrio sp.]